MPRSGWARPDHRPGPPVAPADPPRPVRRGGVRTPGRFAQIGQVGPRPGRRPGGRGLPGSFASEHPDGLEYVGQKLGFLTEASAPVLSAPIPDYQLPVLGVGTSTALAIATAVAGVVGTLVVFGVGLGLSVPSPGEARTGSPLMPLDLLGERRRRRRPAPSTRGTGQAGRDADLRCRRGRHADRRPGACSRPRGSSWPSSSGFRESRRACWRCDGWGSWPWSGSSPVTVAYSHPLRAQGGLRRDRPDDCGQEQPRVRGDPAPGPRHALPPAPVRDARPGDAGRCSRPRSSSCIVIFSYSPTSWTACSRPGGRALSDARGGSTGDS